MEVYYIYIYITCKPSNRVPSSFTMQPDILNKHSIFLSSPRTLPPALFFYYTPTQMACHDTPIHVKNKRKGKSFVLRFVMFLPPKFYGALVQCLWHIYICPKPLCFIPSVNLMSFSTTVEGTVINENAIINCEVHKIPPPTIFSS